MAPIPKVHWVVFDIDMLVQSSPEANGVFADEALQRGIVIACAVVVEAGGIVFATGKLVGVVDGAGDGGVAKGLVGILVEERPGGIGQGQRAAQRFGEEGVCADLIRAREGFVNAAGEQIGRRPATKLLLHGVQSVVEKPRSGTADVLVHAPPYRIVLEGRRGPAVDRHQLVARIPRVAARTVAGHVSVGVVGRCRAAPLRQLIGRVIRGRGHRCGQIRAREHC